ncbi:MAG: hypothetical protein JO352_04090 [Chloroflexi bacterium]|nr:hypothetical protein [Chloroflexota bacterium]
MKFVLGIIVGVAGLWLYRSDRARNEARRRLESAPERLQQLRPAAAAGISRGAQRLSEMIDAAPVPDRVKSAAGDAAFNTWAAAESAGHPTPQGDAETNQAGSGA